MTDFLFLDNIEEFRVNRVAGQGLECQRGNELLCAARHDDVNLCSRLNQQAQQFGSLVSSDSTCDT